MNSREYGNESISALKGAERVRKKTSAILGSSGLDGAKHTIYEIIGNATDEHLAGFGNKLLVARYEDGAVSVRDFGRGVPLGWNNGESNWNYILVYEELYAGGKYDDNQEILRQYEDNNDWANFRLEDHPYIIAVGTNGLGAAGTQCSSEYCTVRSYRTGEVSEMQYRSGEHILDELKVTPTTEPDGTFVKWKPDKEVFSDVNIPSSWIAKVCKDTAMITGMDVEYNDCGKVKEFKSSSLEEIMMEETGTMAKGSHFHHIVDEVGDICICFADIVIGKGGRGVEFFHNMVGIKGGTHSSAMDIALSEFFRECAKEEGISIRSSDYSGKISALVSTKANKNDYRGQTKDSVDNLYIQQCIYQCMYNLLKQEYAKGTDWLMEVIEEVKTNARNRIAVAEMSKSIREIEKSTSKRAKISQKFSPCEAYRDGDYASCEWFVVEGDSAGNQATVSRDSMHQCIQRIRGKSLNIYKASIAKLIANAEIKDIVVSLGCGVDLGIDEYETFDISKLKVSKIFWLTDADIDGLHIRMLLFVLFYKLFPELLYQGYVYIVEVPLYTIHMYTDEEIYVTTEEEMNKYKEEHGGEIRRISRFKGLGEMDPEDLWDTGLNPETRRTRQVKIDRNDSEVADVLEILFGKSTERRKQAILGGMMLEDLEEKMNSIDELVDYICSLDMSEVDVEEVEM